jgi:hypothetical protein
MWGMGEVGLSCVWWRRRVGILKDGEILEEMAQFLTSFSIKKWRVIQELL